VVLATNVGAANRVLDDLESSPSRKGAGGGRRYFDLVIIDEAAQALEASCWIPILRGRRVVLAGDHRQLPPTITSRDPEVRRELGRTMFERVMEWDTEEEAPSAPPAESASRMLEVQYRMHEDIANWSSRAVYNGKLTSHASVRTRRLVDLPHVKERMRSDAGSDGTPPPASLRSTTRDATLLLVDTAGCEMHEEVDERGSRYNIGEAHIVARHVRNLVSVGTKPAEIAVVTPYNGQVGLLRRLLPTETYPGLEVRSVDGFQGG